MQTKEDLSTQEAAPGDHDDLGVHPERREAEVADLENLYAASPDGPETDGFYRNSRKEDGKLASAGKFLKKKKWIFLAGGSLLTVILVFIIFLFLLGSLFKIPHLMENITNYEFARITRQASLIARTNTEEAMALRSTSDTMYGALKREFGNLRDNTWAKWDKYRPDRAAHNLHNNNGLEWKIARKGGRDVLQYVELDGVRYDVKQLTRTQRWTPFLSKYLQLKNEMEFLSRFQPVLIDSINANQSGQIVRSMSARNVRRLFNISATGWNLTKFKGKRGDAALVEQVRQEHAAAKNARTKPTGTSTGSLKSAESDVRAAEENALKDDAKVLKAAQSDGILDDVAAASKKASDASFGKAALEVANPLYAIALPLCIIFDGSIQHAAGTIDNESAAHMSIYTDMAAKADQQKLGVQRNEDSGELTEAVSATGLQLGDISDSNPLRRVSTANQGKTIDDSNVSSAHASATGSYDYSLINAMAEHSPVKPPQKVLNVANAYASAQCSIITNTYVAVGLSFLNLVATFVTLGGSQAVMEAAGQGARAVVTAYAKEFAKKLFGGMIVKDATGQIIKRSVASRAGKFLMKQGFILGGTVGMTELAKIYVLHNAGQLGSGVAVGNDLANVADSGGNIAAGEYERRMYGGRALSEGEVSESNIKDSGFLRDQQRSKSFHDRYIATSNANSLLSRMSISVVGVLSPGTLKRLPKFTRSLLNPGHTFSNIFARLNPVANAATAGAPYNNVQFGYSADEESLIANDASYGALENQKILEDSGKLEEIKSTYDSCFTESIGSLLSGGKIVRDANGRVKEGEGLCSPNNLSYKNSTFNDLVFRYRVSTFRNAVMKQQTDIQDGPQAGSTGSGGTAGSTIDYDTLFESSENVGCAPGTTPIPDIQDGYHEGKKVPIRLCSIPGFKSSAPESNPRDPFGIPGTSGNVIVNSRVSGAWLALYKASEADGVTLSASSTFRTMAKQQQLWDLNGHDPRKAARPGYSPHQMGLAIDFTGPQPSNLSAQNCTSRVRAPGNATWEWLEKNAARFGIKQYSAESWHWDPLKMPNRCGGDGGNVSA